MAKEKQTVKIVVFRSYRFEILTFAQETPFAGNGNKPYNKSWAISIGLVSKHSV